MRKMKIDIATRLLMAFLAAYALAITFGALLYTERLEEVALFSAEWLSRVCSYAAPLFLLGVLFLCAALMPYVKWKRRLRGLLKHDRVQDVLSDGDCFSSDMHEVLLRLKQQLELEKSDNQNKRAEYLTLQSQINPHFLYNTLESIRYDAIANGVGQIANVSEALAAFFRYTISEKSLLVTLEEELANLDNYFLIQKYRFDDRIKLDIQMPSDERDMMKLLLPKLTLQPIVENAVVHGLESRSSGGVITVKIEITRTRLLIEVQDNGVGIEPEKLHYITDMLEGNAVQNPPARRGIALNNVGKRIQLIFGENYGLHVFSVVNRGTRVSLSVPRILSQDEVAVLAVGEHKNERTLP